MNENTFLQSVMSENHCRYLTICGSARFRKLKEKYQAYYTIKNNLVFAPVNYLLIKEEVENDDIAAIKNASTLAKIHDKKIDFCEAIIVVTDKGDRHVGTHTMREINYASLKDKKILVTSINPDKAEKYYFNNDENYPLYMLKEEYL